MVRTFIARRAGQSRQSHRREVGERARLLLDEGHDITALEIMLRRKVVATVLIAGAHPVDDPSVGRAATQLGSKEPVALHS